MKNTNFRDNDICMACKDMSYCTCPCDILASNSLAVDYKEVISELQEARVKRRIDMIDNIEEIEDARTRLILGGLFFGVSVAEIARLLGLAREYIYELLRPLRKKCE